jgi:hypothetical protein
MPRVLEHELALDIDLGPRRQCGALRSDEDILVVELDRLL